MQFPNKNPMNLLVSNGVNNQNQKQTFNAPPQPSLPVLQKTKLAYLLWYQYYQIIPKLHRFSLGEKVDKLFVEVIDGIVTANFLDPREKVPFVRYAIRKLDILKVFLMMLWETKSLDNKKYINLSEKLNEIGRNLGGWHGKLTKENSPKK